MVLQVGTHTGGVMRYRNAVLLQKRGWANARELQDLRRPNAARAEDDFAGRMGRHHLFAVPHVHTGTALAAVRLRLHKQARHL